MERRNPFIEILGWYGVAAILGAYVLVSTGIVSGTGLAFQVLNLTGAFGITVQTYYRKDYQPFWLNLIWTIIALGSIVVIIMHIH